MNINLPKISNQIYAEQTLRVLDSAYSTVGPNWTAHQMEWANGVYGAFKDHDKFLIVIYLTKKTLDFYSRNFTKLTYDQFYLKDAVEIEEFNVIEIAQEINIPKETARRKIIELEKDGVIKRNKKKIIIDRSAYPFIKPIKSVVRISRFLSVLSELLHKEKILPNKLSSLQLEKTIKNNFTYVWKLYYELQIPMMLGYKRVFGDIETFHIFGTCVVNQHIVSQKMNSVEMNRVEFISSLYGDNQTQGLNAMSISDITGIPRATVVRKLKKLVSRKNLMINKKKHYTLTGSFVKQLMPIQKNVLSRLAEFSTKIYNLVIL